MSSIKLPSVSSGMTTDELANMVAKLIKEIQWLMDGNIDSVNAREIGGWNVGQDSLVATNGNVGLSSKITGGDDVRVWAGSTNPNTAPTRIYNSGKIVTNNIEITGGTISFANITGTIPDSSLASAVNWNGKTTMLTGTGVYTGTLTASQINAINGISLGANATIDFNYNQPSYTQISGTKPPTNADNTTSVIGANRLTKITSTGVYTGTVDAYQVNTVGLSAEKIYQVSDPDNYAVLGGSYGDMVLYYNNAEFFRIYNTPSSTYFQYNSNYGSNYFMNFDESTTYPRNEWNFNNASVSGINTDEITGLESRLQYLEDHAFILSYRSGTNIYFNSKNIAGVDNTDVSG